MSHTQHVPTASQAMDTRPKGRIFYGWWIVFASWTATLLNSATTFAGFGAFFLPILQEFNTSRATITWVVSAARLEGSLLGPLEGWLVDRYGPRRMMAVGIPLLGLGFILLSYVHTIELFYVVFLGGIALGASLGTSTPGTVAVANWFIRKRSTAMGIVATGFSMGTILVPGLAYLIERVGWRSTSFAIGVGILIIGMPLTLLMRHRPEDYGYLPDGLDPASLAPEAKTGVAPTPTKRPVIQEANFTVTEALITPAFWLLGLTFATRTAATVAMNVHQIPFLIDTGFTPTEAGFTVGAVGLVSFVGRVLVGWLGDRWNKQVLMSANLLILGVGVWILAYVETKESILVPLYILAYGVAFGGTNPLMGAIRADFFGRRNYGTVGGFMSLLTLIGTMGGPLLAAYAYDFTGAYTGAFRYIGGASLVGAVLILLARPPAERKHRGDVTAH